MGSIGILRTGKDGPAFAGMTVLVVSEYCD